MPCITSPQNIRSHLRDPGRLLPLPVSSWGKLWLLVHNENSALEGCNACLVGGSAIDSHRLHRQSHHLSTQLSLLACSFSGRESKQHAEVSIQQVPAAGCSGVQPQKEFALTSQGLKLWHQGFIHYLPSAGNVLNGREGVAAKSHRQTAHLHT